MFWDLSNNLRTWGDKLRKKDNCSCCLGIPCWEVGPGFMETDMANPEVCWVTGAVLLAVLFNSIKYFSQRMSYLKKTWKGSPFTLSPSRVESPNIWKQLQMECCELGKNKKKKKGCGNEPLMMKMLSKNRICFFGLCQNDGFLAGLKSNWQKQRKESTRSKEF